MSLLRIRCNLHEAPLRCAWALMRAGREPLCGEGALAALPRHAGRVQLVLPAAQVSLLRARLPATVRRRADAPLAYAVEEKTLGEPDALQVTRLGSAGEEDVLAVLERAALARWLEALESAGVRECEVHCESLLLPWTAGAWSLAWDGREGFLRCGELEGMATDCADRATPPLALRLMLEEAAARGEAPVSLTVYPATPDAAPDADAWRTALGSVSPQIALAPVGRWGWASAPLQAGVPLARTRRSWRISSAVLGRLRPAAWIAGAALALHATALVADWMLLANEQRSLRRHMEAQFRAAFPDAVAVVDPSLQMRRKLAEARHAAGQPDSGDFLPMTASVAEALRGTPPGTVRTLSHENGRMTLELSLPDAAEVQRTAARLRQSGLSVEVAPPGAGGAATVLTLGAP